MGSSFFGLNVSTQGLYTYQTALNVTSHNISNSGVDGYSKQTAEIVASRPLTFGHRGMMGTGAEVVNVKSNRSAFLDEKFWSMNTELGEYNVKDEMLGQIELLLREPSDTGYSTYFSNTFDRLQELYNNPGDVTTRMNFVESSKTLTEYFNNISTQLNDYQRDANFGVKSSVDSINFYAGQISAINNQIQNLELNNNSANDLRDERVRLVDALSKIINIDASEHTDINGKNYFRITIGGTALVDNVDANYLETVSRTSRSNVEDVPDLYDVYWKGTGNMNFIGDIVGGAGTNTITVENFDDSTASISTGGSILIDGTTYQYSNATFVDQPDPAADQMVFTTTDPVPATATGVEIYRPSIGRKLDLNNSQYSGELKGYMELRDGNNAENFTGTLSVPATGTNTITVGGISEHDIPGSGQLYIGGEAFGYNAISYNDATNEMTFTINNTSNPVYPAGANVTIGEAVDFKGIPHYMERLNNFVRTVAKEFNRIHEQGNGGAAGDLFAYEGYNGTPDLDENNDFTYNTITIGNFSVAPDIIDNYDNLYTSAAVNAGPSDGSLIEDMIELRHDVNMFSQGEPDNYMQAVISEMAVDGKKASEFKSSQENLLHMVNNQRESYSSVDLNEETTDMIRFQQAYQLSAKMIQVMDEVYDVMINQLKR